MPALVSFASVLRISCCRLGNPNSASLLRRVLCLRQPPKLVVKDRVAEATLVILTDIGSVVKYLIPQSIMRPGISEEKAGAVE